MKANIVNHQSVGILSLLLIILGMLVSEAMMSIGMILLTANAVFNTHSSLIFKNFFRHKALIALTGLCLLYLISGLWSDNYHDFVDRVRMKLPFLFMPLAILSIPKFDKRIYANLLYVFFICVVTASLVSLFFYVVDFQEFNKIYSEGRVMPTPGQHVRFSLMAAFCVAIGFYLWQEGHVWRYRWETTLIAGLTGFLLLYLHVLAVRSGLLALYAMGLYYALLVAIKGRRFSVLIGVTLGILFAGGLAYRYLPSFQNRFHYTIYTIQMFTRQEAIRDLSDARRLGSIYGGLDLWKNAPWLGVGAGDIKDEMERYLRTHFPELGGLDLMPHNQFLLVGAGMGILGFLYFSGTMLYCLWYRRAWREPLFTSFFILIFTSFLVEHTLETQLGTAFFTVFCMMGLRYFYDKACEIPEDN
jgi:O-antigen ligase